MTERLKHYETLIKVLSRGEYSMNDKTKLYADVKKFCEDNPEITPDFEFRHRGGRLSSPDVDVTLRNLMDSKRIVSEEHSGLIIILKD
ncbi:MAG: hypothetical protein Q8L27_02660 [archaeon]|nr:hypothetical protein [archaeon]